MTGAALTPDYASLLKHMGACLGIQGQHAQAMHVYVASKKAFEVAGASKTPQYASLLSNMGSCLGAMGENTYAMEHFMSARAAFERVGAVQTVEFATLLKNIGACHGAQGKHAEAMRSFQDSKEAFERSGAAAMPDYGELLQNMGACLASQGQMTQAMQFYQAGHVMGRRVVSCRRSLKLNTWVRPTVCSAQLGQVRSFFFFGLPHSTSFRFHAFPHRGIGVIVIQTRRCPVAVPCLVRRSSRLPPRFLSTAAHVMFSSSLFCPSARGLDTVALLHLCFPCHRVVVCT